MGIFRELEQEFDYEIVEEFVSHFQNMCDAMPHLCVTICTPESFEFAIQELFRIFHNLKAASSYFRLTMINKISTLVESILDEARSSESRHASYDLYLWLLDVYAQCVEWLEDFILDNNTLSPINVQILKLPAHITV